MPAHLIASSDTVQVFSPSLVADALICTAVSSPSGSVLLRTITKADFDADKGKGLLDSLSAAVEQILQEGIATDAAGIQGVDASGLLYDAVVFTVTYVPPGASAGGITATTEIPVNSLTLDTQFGSFVTGPTPAEQILATYNHLKTLAGG